MASINFIGQFCSASIRERCLLILVDVREGIYREMAMFDTTELEDNDPCSDVES